ncbi:MAG: electron transfer flavoprotein beta subunit/FixA family protein [Actinobacteria bacterium]|nr:electron transfer flavoprotein beta subunit/FixA family protein [Actinomycetota bacterium]
MRILVCVKRVPAPGSKINITADGQRVDDTNLGHTTSPHEECAVEAASQLIEEHGGEWDPQRTAAAIAAAVTSLEAEGGPFDLVLFGNESADSSGFQVGIRVAHALGRPMVNGAKGLRVEGATAHVEREADAGREAYELPMPAVVGVKEGINLPRYPTMKGRLASKKAGVVTVEPAGEAGGLQMVTLKPPPERTNETVILGNGPEAAAAVVDVLEEIGVL